MALDMDRLKRIAERLAEKKDLQERINKIKRLNRKDMPVAIEEMAQEGTRAHVFSGIGNLHMKRKVFARFDPRIAPDDDASDAEKQAARARAMEALDAAGLGMYGRRSIDWQGLTARLKEMDENGEELPDELKGVLILDKGYELALNSSRKRSAPEVPLDG